MIQKLIIHKLVLSTGTCLFNEQSFNIDKFENTDLEKYWYINDDIKIAPNSVLFEGDFSTGKSTIFKILECIRDIIIQNKYNKNFVLFDVEIHFYIKEMNYQYHIIKDDKRISDSINGETPSVKGINLTKEKYPIPYSWFEKLIFIPSIYDDNENYTFAVKKYLDEQNINEILSKEKSYFQHSSHGDYCIKYEGEWESTAILSTLSSNISIRTPLEMINQSTYDLILSLSLIYALKKSNDMIMIIDDIDLIAKLRFMHFAHCEYVALGTQNMTQLIGFSNGFHQRKYGIVLFNGAKKIHLKEII